MISETSPSERIDASSAPTRASRIGLAKRDAWFGSVLARRARESSGVRELEAEHEIVDRAESFPVRSEHRLAERFQPGDRIARHVELVRIGTAVRPDGDGLAAPEELRAAQSEVAPPPNRELGGSSVVRSVPTFHRMDRPAVADRLSASLHGIRERRSIGGEDFVVDLELRQEPAHVFAKRVASAQRPDARKAPRGIRGRRRGLRLAWALRMAWIRMTRGRMTWIRMTWIRMTWRS